MKNVIKISHSCYSFPNIFLDYDLSEKVVAITKIEGDSSESTGVATTLSLTLSETDAILKDLQRFADLFKWSLDTNSKDSTSAVKKAGMIAKLGALMQPLQSLFSRAYRDLGKS